MQIPLNPLSTSLNGIHIHVCIRIGTIRNTQIQIHANMLKNHFPLNIVQAKIIHVRLRYPTTNQFSSRRAIVCPSGANILDIVTNASLNCSQYLTFVYNYRDTFFHNFVIKLLFLYIFISYIHRRYIYCVIIYLLYSTS